MQLKTWYRSVQPWLYYLILPQHLYKDPCFTWAMPFPRFRNGKPSTQYSFSRMANELHNLHSFSHFEIKKYVCLTKPLLWWVFGDIKQPELVVVEITVNHLYKLCEGIIFESVQNYFRSSDQYSLQLIIQTNNKL